MVLPGHFCWLSKGVFFSGGVKRNHILKAVAFVAKALVPDLQFLAQNKGNKVSKHCEFSVFWA
jgi:hypothetical protein